jgi:WD40 repeat protein
VEEHKGIATSCETSMARYSLSLAALALLAAPVAAQGRGQVTAVAFTPDGRTLLAAGLDGHVRSCDPDTGKPRRAVLAHKGGVFALALSADGKRFVTAGADGVVRLWDAATLEEARAFRGHKGRVAGAAISPDGKWVASGGYDGSVRLWDAGTGKPAHELGGHEHRVTGVAFSPDGKTLASAGIVRANLPGFSGPTVGDRVRLWDVEKGKLREALGLRGDCVVFSPDGRGLAAAGLYLEQVVGPAPLVIGRLRLSAGSRIGLVNWPSRAERYILNGHYPALAFSPDGKLLVSGWGSTLHYDSVFSAGGTPARGIHLWDAATGKEVLHVDAARGNATALAFSPDGRSLAAGTASGQVQVRSLAPPGWSAPKNLAAAGPEKCWGALAEATPAAGYRAVWDLTAVGDEAVGFLAGRIKPAPAFAAARLRKLLKELDADEFAVREEAQKGLAKLGDAVEGDLEAALNTRPSPEARRRLLALLADIRRGPVSVDELRARRAVQVLERVGTPAARKALAALAGGAPGAHLTLDARAALGRLERRAR